MSTLIHWSKVLTNHTWRRYAPAPGTPPPCTGYGLIFSRPYWKISFRAKRTVQLHRSFFPFSPHPLQVFLGYLLVSIKENPLFLHNHWDTEQCWSEKPPFCNSLSYTAFPTLQQRFSIKSLLLSPDLFCFCFCLLDSSLIVSIEHQCIKYDILTQVSLKMSILFWKASITICSFM